LYAAGSLPVASGEAVHTIVVDRNGRGHFRNIREAIDSLRSFDPADSAVIFVREGFYKEKLTLPPNLCRLTISGENRDKTIINYDDHANINRMGTFQTYTFRIRADAVVLENLTIENSAQTLGQAVALHLEGDRITVRNCRLLGNQDTLYTGQAGCKHCFAGCYIEGTTDFIFGPSTAWFEDCEIHCKKNSFITAASTPDSIACGYIFNRCTITAATGVTSLYLGRPWRPYAMTLFMNCRLPEAIHPQGWDNWRNKANEQTARYMEYNNSGPGAATSARASWTRTLSNAEAAQYTLENVMKDRQTAQ
jgi:pectinesterase